MLLIFDVDGTLTPSRGLMDPGFKRWFMEDLRLPFVLITGSDPAKTREQIGNDLYESTTVYNCTGNHVFDHGVETHRSDWRIPAALETFLEQALQNSRFDTKTGRHIEHRTGLCNFSVVGRNASLDDRKRYFDWDLGSGERISLVRRINDDWEGVEAGVAGETGIDIYQKGTGKDQLMGKVGDRAPLHFFGDRMDANGNDYKLGKAITDANLGYAHHVRDWEHTWELLKDLNEVHGV